ncbi:hypothetical protein [Herbidospora daliensis]|uniref:hypothetical protein n=1 Tax=Herbidospora daliensis TaxID=295585 RepID=UPI000784C3EB|nr:hypothetical protein [Herbidospora daliensis]
MNRVRLALLSLLLFVSIGGCTMWSSPEAELSEGVRDLEAAMSRVLQVARPEADPKITRDPWPCEDPDRKGVVLGHDLKVADPRGAVAAVLELWRSEGLRIELDRSTDTDRPEVIAGGPLIELSIHGFPDRNTIYIEGNTVCLPGPIPENWHDVV